MCGIAGEVRADRGPVDAAFVRAMGASLRHRGPDDDGLWVDGPVGLAHRRLSVLDLSPAGRQPMANEDGTVQVVFNGEIYNFQELRAGLESRHTFRSRTDTEVLVHLYEEHGPACVSMLRGMFAFALWDARRERLLLARDRVGKKPLFYRHDATGLRFASELKALLADGRVPDVDAVALHHYLTFQYVPAPWTIVRGIRKLRPGHVLVYERGTVTEEPYWTLGYTNKLAPRSDADYQAAFREQLEEAVRIRLISDVPLGAFLSGGIDSSTVVAVMSRLSARPVQTFSIGFRDDAFNELPYARMVAERFKTDHHEFIVEPRKLDLLPALVRVFDEPFADSSAIPTYCVSELSRKTVTVVLNGDGGDELLAGYPRYAFTPWDAFKARWLPPSVGAMLRTAAAVSSRAARAAGEFSDTYLRRICYFSPEEKAALYTPEFAAVVAADDSADLLRTWFRAGETSNLLDQLLDVDTRSYLPDDLLVKVDRTTMAHGLEARSPLLDHRLMEFAAALPPDQKRRGGDAKFLLKRVMRGVLPDAVLDRPKMGFGVPIDRWLREDCRELLEDVLLSPRAQQRGYFRPERVRALVDAHVAGQTFGYRLYALLMLELWHRQYVDAPAPVEAACIS